MPGGGRGVSIRQSREHKTTRREREGPAIHPESFRALIDDHDELLTAASHRDKELPCLPGIGGQRAARHNSAAATGRGVGQDPGQSSQTTSGRRQPEGGEESPGRPLGI